MRERMPHSGQNGFTLIELLVVILILGILGAIAIPAFLAQRSRAQDAGTKEEVRVARMALDTFALDGAGYAATAAELIEIEPSLAEALNLTVTGTPTTFKVSVDSPLGENGGTFSMERDPIGRVRRDCLNKGQGGCRKTPDANGDYW